VIPRRDRPPLAAAVLAVIAVNAATFALDVTHLLGVAAIPAAVVAFAATNYVLYGEPFPSVPEGSLRLR
jgi:hypothetical protein